MHPNRIHHQFKHIFLTFLILISMTYATKLITVPAFNLSAPAGTDIWRKPPTTDVFNAPTHPSPLHKFPLKSFQRARLTFLLPKESELRQYDQAGLLLHFTKEGEKDKWIKTGIEFYQGAPYLSTVGTDRWSDWSVVPLLSASGDQNNDRRPGATVEARREKDQLGKSLWVYGIEGEKESPLREVNWVFADEEGWEVGVGGFVARPTKEGPEGLLEAEFKEGVVVEVLDYEKL
jgi:regulation of enolase protein 1 (concanavalin A-like superfamily)